MSTHNLCFGAKIRKIGIPLQTPFSYIKVGFKGLFIARTCFPDDILTKLKHATNKCRLDSFNMDRKSAI